MSVVVRLAAVALLAAGVASHAEAAMISRDITFEVTGPWVHPTGPNSPYGLPDQPVITGEIVYYGDPAIPKYSDIVSLFLVTGSRTWTAADLDTNYVLFFETDDYIVNQIQLIFKTGRDAITMASTTNLNDGVDRIYCNSCVRITTDQSPAVPEPSTWLLMISGFGLVGAALRRRARPVFAS